MKIFVALAFLVIGVTSNPASQASVTPYDEGGLVTGQIIQAINDVAENIRDLGLDPLLIKREAAYYALPVPIIFNAGLFAEDIHSHGLSNIVIHDVSYSLLFSRLTFDIELPLIHFSVGKAVPEFTIFGNTVRVENSGSVDIRNIRVRGVVNVRVGVISGITITNVSINFTLGGVDSNMNLKIVGTDYSNQLNTFLGGTIPNTIAEFKPELDELIAIILLDIINENL